MYTHICVQGLIRKTTIVVSLKIKVLRLHNREKIQKMEVNAAGSRERGEIEKKERTSRPEVGLGFSC